MATAAVLGVFAAQLIYPDNHALAPIGAGVTIADIILLITHLTFGVEQEVVAHKNSALKYMALRDRYKSFIADIVRGVLSGDELAHRRDDIRPRATNI